ncbi:TPA: hypothetical protein OUL50_001940 [Clostridioides difficile]|nr:hypothetical protein [Clostridioides difficile]HBF9360002.1 hypothetical protein [Clostridioides difficile]HBG1536282.1 hypothetical protein [Clostridioides difficile]HCU2754242.1 hypothetical protein [Clostridioides difficile]
MLGLIKLQIRLIFNKKIVITSVISFILLIGLQLLKLSQNIKVYNIDGNLLDALIVTLGNWQSPVNFLFILSSLILMIICSYLSISSFNIVSDLNKMTLNRSKSRLKLWISSCITQIILTLFIFTIIFIFSLVFGTIFFKHDIIYSLYNSEFYNINISPFKLIPLIMINFITGLYSLFMIIQIILLLSKKSLNTYILAITIFTITSIAYIYDFIPRIFAPFSYVSSIFVNNSNLSFELVISSNILIAIICILLGSIIYFKKDL